MKDKKLRISGKIHVLTETLPNVSKWRWRQVKLRELKIHGSNDNGLNRKLYRVLREILISGSLQITD